MRILIADTMHPSLLPMLTEKGWLFDYCPDMQRPETIERIGAYDGIVIRSKTTLDEAVFSRAPRLQFIARAGAGMDQIDVEAARRYGIQLFNAPEGNRDAVAEHAVGMLLALLNHLSVADRQVRNRVWNREGNRGTEISSKTIGIIGYGNTGRAFARRLSGFSCRVLAYDKYLTDYSDQYARAADMEEIFAAANVLSLHVPLTTETHHLVNWAYLARFARPIYLINTARGEIIPMADLVAAIESGKVRGACLDVLENEKLATLTPDQQRAFDALAASDNVLFSPHVAGWTHESYVRINEVLVRKITAWRDAAGSQQ